MNGITAGEILEWLENNGYRYVRDRLQPEMSLEESKRMINELLEERKNAETR